MIINYKMTTSTFSDLLNTFQPFLAGSPASVTDTIGTYRSKSMPTNIEVSPDKYDVYIAMPGFAIDELSLSMEDNVLTVSTIVPETEEDDTLYQLRDFKKVSTSRSYKLSGSLDAEINASLSAGILHIKVSRPEKSQKKNIPISETT